MSKEYLMICPGYKLCGFDKMCNFSKPILNTHGEMSPCNGVIDSINYRVKAIKYIPGKTKIYDNTEMEKFRKHRDKYRYEPKVFSFRYDCHSDTTSTRGSTGTW